MNTATGSSLEHAIGADGLLALRLRSGDVRINAVDGEVVRVRDTDDQPLDELFAIEAAAGSLSLTAGGPGLRVHARSDETGAATRRPRPGSRDRPPARRHARPRSRQQRHRGRRPARRPALSNGVGRRDAARRRGQIEIEAVSGDVEIQATGEPGPGSIRVGRHRAARRDADGAPADHDQRRHEGRRPARRPRPVRDRDGQWRRAPRTGRRRPDRDDQHDGRPPVRARWAAPAANTGGGP